MWINKPKNYVESSGTRLISRQLRYLQSHAHSSFATKLLTIEILCNFARNIVT
jgi:hypothetical protein